MARYILVLDTDGGEIETLQESGDGEAELGDLALEVEVALMDRPIIWARPTVTAYRNVNDMYADYEGWDGPFKDGH